MLAQDTGDLAEARRLYEQSLQISRELGDKWGIAHSLGQLGNLESDIGDIKKAHLDYQECLTLFRELGDMQGIGSSLHNLGLLAENEDHLAEALQLFEESFKMFNDLQSPNAKIAQESIARVREKLEKSGN
jgi:tetratricopeptide (TPR) repeat protein